MTWWCFICKKEVPNNHTHINKCWRIKGCPFNSNNSLSYMKCLQSSYSVEQCKKDNEGQLKIVDKA